MLSSGRKKRKKGRSNILRHTINFPEQKRGTMHRFKKHSPEQDKL